MAHPPKSLQSVLWSADIAHVDTQRDKAYIVHQILSHGTLETFRWLFQTYTKEEIRDVFLKHPYREYRPSRFHFVTHRVLELPRAPDARHYVYTAPRAIG